MESAGWHKSAKPGTDSNLSLPGLNVGWDGAEQRKLFRLPFAKPWARGDALPRRI
jgi:hypothetical protein